MKVKDIIKKQTTIIAIAVVLVAITVIGVSYAIFFDVKGNTDNQVITAGTLKLTIEGITALNVSEPISEEAGLASSPVSYTPKNTGNLPAAYSIYLYANTSNTIPLNKLKVSTDGTTSKTLTAITSENIDGKAMYKIDSGDIAAGATGSTKKVRVWVDEGSYSDEASGEVVDLNMYIVSEVDES